jgi:predicted RNase H-like nuclease
MAWVVCQDQVPEKCVLPRLVGFADAAEIIEDLQRECDDVLVAIDQPIIVPNDVGRRPVDCIADSVMQHLKSSALRANRTERGEGFNNTYLHGNEAPIWKFMSRIGPCGYSGTTDRDDKGAFVDFQAAQMPTDDRTHRTHVIEVYPALALTALNPIFMCRGSTARYDPENYGGRHRFSLHDWKLVCSTVACCADHFDLQEVSKWAKEMEQPWVSPRRPRKLDQDKIDAALCLLIAQMWRRQTHEVRVIGDVKTGYMVTPTSDATRKILEAACAKHGIVF